MPALSSAVTSCTARGWLMPNAPMSLRMSRGVPPESSMLNVVIPTPVVFAIYLPLLDFFMKPLSGFLQCVHPIVYPVEMLVVSREHPEVTTSYGHDRVVVQCDPVGVLEALKAPLFRREHQPPRTGGVFCRQVFWTLSACEGVPRLLQGALKRFDVLTWRDRDRKTVGVLGTFHFRARGLAVVCVGRCVIDEGLTPMRGQPDQLSNRCVRVSVQPKVLAPQHLHHHQCVIDNHANGKRQRCECSCCHHTQIPLDGGIPCCGDPISIPLTGDCRARTTRHIGKGIRAAIVRRGLQLDSRGISGVFEHMQVRL